MRESAQTIEAAASDWVVRIDRGLTEGDRMVLEEWLAGDMRRLGALARNQAMWLHADRAQAFPTASELSDSRSTRWRSAMPWISTAAALLVLATALWAWQGYSRTHLATAVGEIRQVPLADGSRITLGARTRVAIEYEPATRLVRLESGGALFEVAKDSKHPFVVQAGSVRVRAVGTAFVVDRRPDGDVEVTVTKGIVDVWRETTSPEPAVRLAAGKRTLVTAREIAEPELLTSSQLARATAWDRGVINLNGRTLGEAAADFNRYNQKKVIIANPELAAQKLVGRLEVRDPTAFVIAVAAMFDAHVRTDGDQIILEPGSSLEK